MFIRYVEKLLALALNLTHICKNAQIEQSFSAYYDNDTNYRKILCLEISHHIKIYIILS